MARASSSCWVKSEKFFISPPLFRLFGGERQLQPERARDPRAIGGVGFGAIGDVALLDVKARIAHGTGRVLEQHLLFGGRHQTKEVAGLLPVIVVDAMVVMCGFALDLQ